MELCQENMVKTAVTSDGPSDCGKHILGTVLGSWKSRKNGKSCKLLLGCRDLGFWLMAVLSCSDTQLCLEAPIPNTGWVWMSEWLVLILPSVPSILLGSRWRWEKQPTGPERDTSGYMELMSRAFCVLGKCQPRKHYLDTEKGSGAIGEKASTPPQFTNICIGHLAEHTNLLQGGRREVGTKWISLQVRTRGQLISESFVGHAKSP